MNNYATYKNLFTTFNGGERGKIIKEKKNIIIVILVIIIILFIDLSVMVFTEKPSTTELLLYITSGVFMGFYIFQSYIALTSGKPKNPQIIAAILIFISMVFAITVIGIINPSFGNARNKALFYIKFILAFLGLILFNIISSSSDSSAKIKY